MCVLPFFESVKDTGDGLEVVLSNDFSNKIKGDQLFELVNRLFPKAKFKYVKGCIALLLPTLSDWLIRVVELFSEFMDWDEQ